MKVKQETINPVMPEGVEHQGSEITLENMARPDLFRQAILQIAAEVIREEKVFARCRRIVEQGFRPPAGIELELVDDCVVVRADGREVARQFADDPDDWYFEYGPWVESIEELPEALPAAA